MQVLDEKMKRKLKDIAFCESVSTNPSVQRDLYIALNEDEQPKDFWFGTFNTAEEASDAILNYYNMHPEELGDIDINES